MKRYVINRTIIDNRNNFIINNQKRILKRIKQLVHKRRYILYKDLSVDLEDVVQEIFEDIVLSYDKSSVKKEPTELYDEDAFLTRLILNSIVDLMRSLEAQRRGGSRNKMSGMELVYLEDVPEELLQIVQDEHGMIDDVYKFFKETNPNELGVDEKTWNIFTDYFAFGYTFDEIAERHGYASRSGVYNVVSRASKEIFPLIRDKLEDIVELNSVVSD